MRLFALFIIAFAIMAPSFAGDTEKFAKLSKAHYESLNLLGVFKLNDQITVDLGKIYAGDAKYGLLKLKNSTNRNIKIKTVRSSCGCSALYPSSSEIRAGQAIEIAVKMSGTRVGSLKSTLTIETDVEDYLISLRATGARAVELTHSTAEPQDGVVTFTLKLNDPRLRETRVQALVDGTPSKLISNKNGEAVFQFKETGKDNAVIVPRFNGTDFLPLQLQIVVPGRFRVVTSSVFGHTTDQNFEFRLLVLGDHNIDTSLKSSVVHVGNTSHKAEVQCRQLGKLLHVHFAIAKAVEGQAVAELGEKEIPFFVRKSP
jgi:hypothetical protein